jgi:hypothetical protein
MIPVKEAVARAVEFASSRLQPPPGLGQQLTLQTGLGQPWGSGIRLEEVGLGKIGRNDVWLITLSLPDRAGLGSLGRREYKVFTVRCDNGEVVSMKIRELANAQ